MSTSIRSWGCLDTDQNGTDFKANIGCPVYAMHDGVVYYCGTDDGGGIEVDIWDEVNFKTIYYHLSHFVVTSGQRVKEGDLIAYSGNTGKLTTGPHLHVMGKETNNDGTTKNWDNGYKGAINIQPMFTKTYNGVIINNKDWDKSRCYHRYYRGRPKGGYQNELKIMAILGKKKIWPTSEKINALVYGAWPIEAIKNPAMYENYSQLKFDEYTQGKRPFSKNI